MIPRYHQIGVTLLHKEISRVSIGPKLRDVVSMRFALQCSAPAERYDGPGEASCDNMIVPELAVNTQSHTLSFTGSCLFSSRLYIIMSKC